MRSTPPSDPSATSVSGDVSRRSVGSTRGAISCSSGSLFRLNVRDTQVGAKVFRREMLSTVTPLLVVKRWAFDLEVLAVGAEFGFDRVVEVPVQLGLPVLRHEHQLAGGPKHAARHARDRLPPSRPPLVRETLRGASSAERAALDAAGTTHGGIAVSARGILVGLGRMGSYHLRVLRAHPEVELVAIAEPDARATRRCAVRTSRPMRAWTTR